MGTIRRSMSGSPSDDTKRQEQAVAVANAHGPQEGLKAVRAIRDREKLASYYLFYSVAGELEMRLNNCAAAAEQFRKAFELAETKSERAFLLKRLKTCEEMETGVEQARGLRPL